MNESELKEFLDEKYHQFNVPSYIDSDPIQIPHQFNKKEDIEISAFLTSTIAWGQRKTIIKNAFKMMHLMDNLSNKNSFEFWRLFYRKSHHFQ